MENYICPHCKEKQNSITQWETISVAYEFDLKNGDSVKIGEGSNSEHEKFSCPNCGEKLPEKMSFKIWDTIWNRE